MTLGGGCLQLADSQALTGLRAADGQDSSFSSLVHPVVGNELRVGKPCMIDGFPCRIREIKRSAPGKHGHAKLRIVGSGILDGKRRDTLLGARDTVQVPIVENHQGVKGVAGQTGIQIDPSQDIYRLLPVANYPELDSNESDSFAWEYGQNLLLDLAVTCGHYRVVRIRPDQSMPEDESRSSSDHASNRTSVEDEPRVLSKKDARKLKKHKKRTKEEAVESKENHCSRESL